MSFTHRSHLERRRRTHNQQFRKVIGRMEIPLQLQRKDPMPYGQSKKEYVREQTYIHSKHIQQPKLKATRQIKLLVSTTNKI